MNPALLDVPAQRVVIAIPERASDHVFNEALWIRDLYEARGYRTELRYGEAGFDDDVTPIEGSDIPALLVRLSAFAP